MSIIIVGAKRVAFYKLIGYSTPGLRMFPLQFKLVGNVICACKNPDKVADTNCVHDPPAVMW